MLEYFPKPLLDDIVADRCVPLIGAGFSRNADLPLGMGMPDWKGLGSLLASAIPSYPDSTPLDAISAYAHEYSRVRLVEQLSRILLINVARPGPAHRAFCGLFFSTVCTTNFDFLLEQAYADGRIYCQPILDEDRLSIGSTSSDPTYVVSTLEVKLLKIHGDLHHPGRLVATEDDFDTFIDRNPLLATYLANLWISKTALFIGYSLDDPDLRSIWQIIADRLGKLRRPAYALAVGASQSDIARFARRGVRVINLPGKVDDYSIILETVFKELREYWSAASIKDGTVTREDARAQLSLPTNVSSRLCLFLIPVELSSFYKDIAYPVALSNGFTPITTDEVFAPGDNTLAKVVTLIERADVLIIDVSSTNTVIEAQMATLKQKPVLLIVESDRPLPADQLLPFNATERQVALLWRPSKPYQEATSDFATRLGGWFQRIDPAYVQRQEFWQEPKRLLDLGEYRAAIVSAATVLESELRIRTSQGEMEHGRVIENISIRQLVTIATAQGIIDKHYSQDVEQLLTLRNQVVHGSSDVNQDAVRYLVQLLYKVLDIPNS